MNDSKALPLYVWLLAIACGFALWRTSDARSLENNSSNGGATIRHGSPSSGNMHDKKNERDLGNNWSAVTVTHQGAVNGKKDGDGNKEDDDDRVKFEIRPCNIKSWGKVIDDHPTNDISVVHAEVECEREIEYTLNRESTDPEDIKGAIYVQNVITMHARADWHNGSQHLVRLIGDAKPVKGGLISRTFLQNSNGSQTTTDAPWKISVSGSGSIGFSKEDGGKGKKKKGRTLGAEGDFKIDTGGESTETSNATSDSLADPKVTVVIKDAKPTSGYQKLSFTYGPKTIESKQNVLLKCQASTEGSDAKTNLEFFKVNNKVYATFEISMFTTLGAPSINLDADDEPVKDPQYTYPWYPAAWAILSPTMDPYGQVPGTTTGMTASASDPHGLPGETGFLSGHLYVWIDNKHSEDLVLDVVAHAGTTAHHPDQIVVSAGGYSDGIPFGVDSAGSYGFTLTLLDDQGDPTSVTLDVAGTASSVGSYPDPLTFVHLKGWLVSRPTKTVGPFEVGRLGWTDYDSESTVVDVVVDDPLGILESPAPSATILPGESSATISFPLTSVEGVATIRFLFEGDEIAAYEVESREQRLICLDEVRVPVGSKCTLPIDLGIESQTDQVLSAVSTNMQSLQVDTPSATVEGDGIHRREVIELSALTVGTGTLTISSDPLGATKAIPFSVTVADVEVSRSDIILHGMSGDEMGYFEFVVPDGYAFATVSGPAGSADYLEIEGIGSDVLMVRFSDGATRPSDVTLTVTYSGPLSAFDLSIDDGVHDQVLVYSLEVPAGS